MQSLKYVTLGDRTSVVLSQVNDLLSGEISIGESICSIDDLVDFMVARILDHLGIAQKLVKRWGRSDL